MKNSCKNTEDKNRKPELTGYFIFNKKNICNTFNGRKTTQRQRIMVYYFCRTMGIQIAFQ